MPFAPPWSERGWDAGPGPRHPARWRAVPPAVLLGAVTVAGTALAALRQPAARPLDAAGVLLLLVAPTALLGVWRRGAIAVVAAAVAVTANAGYVAAGYPWGPFFLPLLAVVGVLAATGRRWLARAVAVGAPLAVLGAAAARGDGLDAVLVTLVLAWLALGLLLAEAARGRGEWVRAARAARLAREQTAVAAERLRIARELHDVLSHSLSAINVQAGVGLHLMDRDPEAARTALRSIRTSSGHALDEVRGLLGVLRADGEAPPRSPVDVDFAATLDAVLDEARAGGLVVEADVSAATGIAGVASGEVGRTVHRLVQESLTNVRRHSAAPSARVTLDEAAGGLEVAVHDDGPARAPAAASGFGLVGMRERVEASGGRLAVGPDPAGGFTVRAWLPLRAAR